MKRKWFFSALGLLLAGGMCWLLFGFTINFPPKSPLQKLNDARALWQAKGSNDYQIDVGFGAAFSAIYTYRIVVHKNSVTEIYKVPFYVADADAPTLGQADGKLTQDNFVAQAIAPDLKDYTVDRLFDIAAPKLETQPTTQILDVCAIDMPSPKVSFNLEYGYIESYELASCPRWDMGFGLMCPVITDCYAGMKVRNFKVLPPS